jgi:DNA repair protein RecO (recombination protein O)
VAPSFQFCSDGEPVDPGQWYCVDLQRGLQRSVHPHDPERLSGLTVMALARRDFSDPSILSAAQAVLRRLIGYHLEGKPLNARRVLIDLRAL